jgi:pimeloyl-ACP methyl ester carboxylesterase
MLAYRKQQTFSVLTGDKVNVVMMKELAIAAAAVLLLAALPATAEPVQLSWKGIRLNGELTLPMGGSLGDGVVLITHGSLAHHDMEIVVAIRETLLERDIASLAISLGFGIDDRKGFYDCAVGPNLHKRYDAVDEIGAWVDWLKGQGANRIAVMGHSAGGNQTAIFGVERPDPAVRAMLLLAPGSYDTPGQAASYKRRFGRDLSSVLEQARGMAPDDRLEDVSFINCESATVSAASFRSYYEPDPRGDTPAVLKKSPVPVLVVAGSEDTVVGNLRDSIAPLAGGNLEYLLVEGANHFFLDLYMEDVADAIAAFLGDRW